ncbi:MAG: ClpXP protease specificity-enhancing factor SspB [Alphaproteobacteria bacterium]|nr:ClpXP protease specificity-enhancing factor SspB [Alphaproteobacteria bacterium]
MTDDLLRYDKIVENALRSVVRTALDQIADHGLPGNHSLYITFRTDHLGVSIPDSLHREYPEEMTIVLEHQFWDLETTEHKFEITLSFNKVHERLSIPFDAVTAFADPSVQFGLKFEAIGELTEGAMAAMTEVPDKVEEAADEKPEDDSEKVVALDAFRKK